jgi:hypothetical protein
MQESNSYGMLRISKKFFLHKNHKCHLLTIKNVFVPVLLFDVDALWSLLLAAARLPIGQLAVQLVAHEENAAAAVPGADNAGPLAQVLQGVVEHVDGEGAAPQARRELFL